ncbi:unnamed protein product [Acanthosepion pharaonis]|uniref:Uncharacterized protein n=1 Tax=Acanthosepion pharaonis TaxID=158019 RepID=A0A812BAR3_ACAPH|nr:unnamed protein product [Sepia pharaonis]
MNAQSAATASASRASETHHQMRLRNRHCQSRDAAETATARAAETTLRRSVRYAMNATNTAWSKAALTFDRRRACQSRDAAATAKSRGPRQSCSGQPAMPATLQRLLLPETPRAHRQRQTNFQGLLQTWPLCNYIKLPKLAAYALTATFSALRSPVIICLSSFFRSFSSFNYDPGINLTTCDDINVGPMIRVCQFCNARKCSGDPAGLCCSSGKV